MTKRFRSCDLKMIARSKTFSQTFYQFLPFTILQIYGFQIFIVVITHWVSSFEFLLCLFSDNQDKRVNNVLRLSLVYWCYEVFLILTCGSSRSIHAGSQDNYSGHIRDSPVDTRKPTSLSI